MMLLRYRFFSLAGIILLMVAGCQTPEKKAEKAAEEKKQDQALRDQDNARDTSLQAFIGRLRKAVANRDVRVLSTMMTNDFAYSWAPGGEGYGCFKYWDENEIWPELQAVVSKEFVANGAFFCAPPEFVEMGERYQGFRAGISRDKGSYKFAYFVPSEDTPMAQPPADGQ